MGISTDNLSVSLCPTDGTAASAAHGDERALLPSGSACPRAHARELHRANQLDHHGINWAYLSTDAPRTSTHIW
jgi:hypothetical protein